MKHLEKGNKIKASVRFKGRQLSHTELGEAVLRRFAEGLSEISEIEQQPKFEFKSIFMTLVPKRK
jgi:translation initiation factor IF-3